MLHRAVLGSIERFIAILLGALRRRFSTLAGAGASEDLDCYRRSERICDKSVRATSRCAGWRVELDSRNEKLGYKIREAQLAKVPYALVIGDKEVEAGTVAPRRRGGECPAAIACRV